MNPKAENDLRIIIAQSFLLDCVKIDAYGFQKRGDLKKKSSWRDRINAIELLSRFDDTDFSYVDQIKPRIFEHGDVSFFVSGIDTSQTSSNALAAIILLRNGDVIGHRLCRCLQASVKDHLLAYYPDAPTPDVPPMPASPAIIGRAIYALTMVAELSGSRHFRDTATFLADSLIKEQSLVFDQWTAEGLNKLSEYQMGASRGESVVEYVGKGVDKYREVHTIALPSHVAGHFLQAYVSYWHLCRRFNKKEEWLEPKIREVYSHLCSLQVTGRSALGWDIEKFEGAFVKNQVHTGEIKTTYLVNALAALLSYKEFLNDRNESEM